MQLLDIQDSKLLGGGQQLLSLVYIMDDIRSYNGKCMNVSPVGGVGLGLWVFHYSLL